MISLIAIVVVMLLLPEFNSAETPLFYPSRVKLLNSDIIGWTNLAWAFANGGEDNGNINKYKLTLVDLDDNIENINNDVIKACYFSVGTVENFRSDFSANEAKWQQVSGNTDPNWTNEAWIILTPEKRSVVEELMLARIKLAKEKGCDVIEGDNVDCYDNDACKTSHATFTESEIKVMQIDYIKWLAHETHKNGMSYLLKNALDIIDDVIDEVDGIMNEQCLQYDECDNNLDKFINLDKVALNVEYSNALNTCNSSDRNPLIRSKFCDGNPNTGLCTNDWVNCFDPVDNLPATTYITDDVDVYSENVENSASKHSFHAFDLFAAYLFWFKLTTQE